MTEVLERKPNVPQITRDAVAAAVRAGMESMRARPPMALSDWAAKNFIMAAESSQQRGGWEAWPFQIGIMDAFSNDDIYENNVIKAKRVGYTKILTASIGFDAAYRRRNQAVWQPTDDDRDSFVKSEIDPMIEGVKAVSSARRMTKGAEDTIKYKQFRDSVAHFLGGKAARAYRRITVASAKLDEIDGFDQKVEKSADPVTLAEGRLEGAAFPSLILGSTPRLKLLSHIEHRASLAKAFLEYHITCPRCDVDHVLHWGGKDEAWGFKWEPGEPDTVRHVCPHCREGITQAEYLANWVGTWVCNKTGIRYGADRLWRAADGQPTTPPRHVAWFVWTAYSPQRAWPDIVEQFLAARVKQKQGDDGPMQGFVNEVLGRTWEVELERTEANYLQKKAEDFQLKVVPRGAMKLVCSVDVQGYGWHCHVWGIGRGEEVWLVDRTVIDGNPADQAEWTSKLEPYLSQVFSHQYGMPMKIDGAAIDTGGHYTHQAYVFVRERPGRNIYAVKGESVPGKPVKSRSSLQDINHRAKVIRKGVRLWFVGTDTAKDLLHERFKLTGDGPGRIHLSKHLDEDVFKQLTNECRVLMKTASGEEYRWVKTPGTRVEDLDCAVYMLFCIQALDLHKMTDRHWDLLERAFEPDLFVSAPTVEVVDGAVVEVPAAPAVDAPPVAVDQPAVQAVPAAAPIQRPSPQQRGGGLASPEWSSRN